MSFAPIGISREVRAGSGMPWACGTPLHDGIDAIEGVPLGGATARLLLPAAPPASVASGPRVGVAGVAGGHEYPWRFWIGGDPTVSAFRWGRGAAPSAV